MEMYKFNVNTYIVPPIEYCTLHELEQICEDRLELYKIIDKACNLNYKPNSIGWEEYVEQEIIRCNLRTYIVLLKNDVNDINQIRARRSDHIAHWLLSLCYSRTKSLRFLFMNWELYWFTMLYKKMKREYLQEFLNYNEIECTIVDQNEKTLLREKLVTCSPTNCTNFNSMVYYKTKFSDVSNIVSRRKVFILKGIAYFLECDMIYFIRNKLWKQFNRQLVWTNKMISTIIKEDRFEYFLKNISVVTPTVKTFSDKKVVVNLDNIDEIAEVHFPLCMKTIHFVLKKEHHLKYDCKMQYGIFLKWIGLSYQHAMEFWKNEFTQKMSSDWFDRKYSYLFKHQYGQVGGLIRYSPYTCKKILSNCPGPGQHHGCPFKHWDLDKLLQRCNNEGFNAVDLNDLKELVINNKFQEACSLYFNVTHKTNIPDIVQSPNQYVEASYEFENSLYSCLNNIFHDC